MIKEYLCRNNADAILFVKPHESPKLIEYILRKKGITITGQKPVRFSRETLEKIQPVDVVRKNRGAAYANAWLDYLSSMDQHMLFVKIPGGHKDAQAALRHHVGATFPNESSPDSIRGTLWRLVQHQKRQGRPRRASLQAVYDLYTGDKSELTDELATKTANLVHIPNDMRQLKRDLKALGEL